MRTYPVSPEALEKIEAARQQLKNRNEGAFFSSVEARVQTAEAARTHGYYDVAVAHYEDAAERAGLLRGQPYLEEAGACARLVDTHLVKR